jgi:hypothetical protein
LVLRVTAPVVGLVLCCTASAPRALGSFIKRGGGAGGGGGARRPVESWRCSRDEVMLVDCWEPAMGIKVMKGHMQKRGESTFGSTFSSSFGGFLERLCSSAARWAAAATNKDVCLPFHTFALTPAARPVDIWLRLVASALEFYGF